LTCMAASLGIPLANNLSRDILSQRDGCRRTCAGARGNAAGQRCLPFPRNLRVAVRLPRIAAFLGCSSMANNLFLRISAWSRPYIAFTLSSIVASSACATLRRTFGWLDGRAVGGTFFHFLLTWWLLDGVMVSTCGFVSRMLLFLYGMFACGSYWFCAPSILLRAAFPHLYDYSPLCAFLFCGDFARGLRVAWCDTRRALLALPAGSSVPAFPAACLPPPTPSCLLCPSFSVLSNPTDLPSYLPGLHSTPGAASCTALSVWSARRFLEKVPRGRHCL